VVTRRRLVVLVVVGTAAAALVGLSAAASTTLRSDTARPAKTVKSARPAAEPAPAVSRPESGQQSAGDIAGFWTKERMRDAQPVETSVRGGSSSSSASPTGKGTPAGAMSKSAPNRKQPASKAASKPDDVVSSPSTSGNADDGWTQDEMDDAQPMGPTVDGGDGAGGSSGPPGGGTGAGTP
jgi:hypothetical protein